MLLQNNEANKVKISQGTRSNIDVHQKSETNRIDEWVIIIIDYEFSNKIVKNMYFKIIIFSA